MSEFEAVAINSVEGSMTAEDGQHLFIKTDVGILGFQASTLPTLLASVLVGIGQTAKLNGTPDNARLALSAESWEIGEAPDRHSVVLTFQVKGETRISVALDRAQAAGVRESLAALTEAGPTHRPDGASVQ